MASIDILMRAQDGLISRRQVLAHGGDDNYIERQLRRRAWASVHRGVYVDHTGPLTWSQRASAAVLYYWPAALSHESALRVLGVRTTEPPTPTHDVIHVAVDQRRRVLELPGTRLHRVSGLPSLVQPNRSPARVRLDHALLDVASAVSQDDAAVGVLADAVQSGRTTPTRLLEALDLRPKLPRRRFLVTVLDDVAAGAYSVLERRYLMRVERPHRLPTGRRQRRVSTGRGAAYRDVEYVGLGLVVELDGRLGHEIGLDRWDDLDRDLQAALAGDVTVRLGWRQVATDGCRTAAAVARLLRLRGWTGTPHACGSTCAVAGL